MTFKKGQSGNPNGRRPRATEEKYLKILRKAVSEDDWAEAVKAIVRQARLGDVAAFKAVAEYLTPKPVQKTETELGGTIRVQYVNDWREE